METPSFRRILELFEAHGVEYVVVGGVAAVLQGAPVTTFDIDALVRVDADNADRLVAALTALEAHYREQRSATLRPSHESCLVDGNENTVVVDEVEELRAKEFPALGNFLTDSCERHLTCLYHAVFALPCRGRSGRLSLGVPNA